MSDLAPAELAEELRLLARSLEGGRFKDAASQAAHMLHPAQGTPVKRHAYSPDYQAMGDCRVCGHGPKDGAAHAIDAIENFKRNRMTTFTPTNILDDFGDMIIAALEGQPHSGQRRAPKVRTSHHRNKEEAARLQALVDERYAQSPGASAEPPTLESVADAIDEARYRHPDHPRQRPRPFNEADRSDREYAIRLARAALLASPGPNPEANAEIDRLRAQVAELERRLECR